MTTLHALMNGEHLGLLDGQGRQVRFRYDQNLDPAEAVPLSLSMPLSRARHRGPVVSRWLTGLLPDRETVLMRWRAEFGLSDLHPESLVAHTGQDVAGACQLVREDRLDAVLSRSGSLAPLSEDTSPASFAPRSRTACLMTPRPPPAGSRWPACR